MKYCSKCQKCYDDSIVDCEIENHGALNQTQISSSNLIEGYEIVTRIESDSPVEIFRATHLDSKKSVLIRFIQTDDSKAELRKKLHSYVIISHQNLCRIFECGETEDNLVYIVSEDLEGKTLREYLDESKIFEEKQAISIARQIAEGLEKLHDSEIVHRLINPQNIYITAKDEDSFAVKLNYPDFCGIIEKQVVTNANAINAKTQIFEYYSPEQFSDEEIDFKTDIYSLAIVFYEMLIGHTPYELLSPQAIKEYIFNEDDVDKLHHDLRALIAYTLRESLQQSIILRPRSTKNLVRQLRHLELVATPSENFLDDEDIKIEPKWKKIIEDRAKVIKELKSPIIESDKSGLESSTVSEKTFLAETKKDLEQYYQIDEDYHETFSEEPKYLGTIDESGDVVDDAANVLLIEESESYIEDEKVSSNSQIFKKSYVYIASAMATVLIGGFFLINFYSWQTDAISNETISTEKAPRQSKSETQKDTDESEVTESQSINNDDAEQDDSSFDMTSREKFEQEREEVKTVSSVNKEQKNTITTNNKVKTERTKSIKKSRNKKQILKVKTSDKKLFEDTVIIVGSKQKDSQTQNKNNKEKRQKVFSDVVITY